jgi:hypothetical protein
VHLDDVRILENHEYGIDSRSGCIVRVRRSQLHANTRSIRVLGLPATVTVENSVVINRYGEDSPNIEVHDGWFNSSYSLLLQHGRGVPNLQCHEGAGGWVRNSIIMRPDGGSVDPACEVLTWRNNAVDTSSVADGNKWLYEYRTGWFKDPGLRDYHLSSSGASMFKDVASRTNTDPVVDLDGDPINRVGMSFAGPDQPTR